MVQKVTYIRMYVVLTQGSPVCKVRTIPYNADPKDTTNMIEKTQKLHLATSNSQGSGNQALQACICSTHLQPEGKCLHPQGQFALVGVVAFMKCRTFCFVFKTELYRTGMYLPDFSMGLQQQLLRFLWLPHES